MFGHGPESRISTGIALRLRCQVFVISGPRSLTGASEVLALLPCELPAPSLYLQRAIATYVAQQHVPIPASRIALMATHTHFGPGHYLQSDGYTGPFSSRRTGLDDRFVRALAKTIGEGIVRAYWAAKPARIGWGYRDLTGLARNRAVVPFLHDDPLPAEIQAALLANSEQPDHAAVDPLLSVMRVDQWDARNNRYQPAGALAFYGVHPSVVNSHNSLYTGDLFGYATRQAAQLIGGAARLTSGFVVGLANGIEGDVTSDRSQDTHREARRLGHKLGKEIAELWSTFDSAPSGSFDVQGPLDVVYRELHWSSAALKDSRIHLCRVPGQGTPAAGGASDHPTSLHIFAAADPGVHEPEPNGPRPCWWPRHPLIAIDPNADPGANYPDVAPLMLARIGRGWLATAPAELTTVAGYRIREELEAWREKPMGKITIAGLTNEYLGYIATREEYQLQHYEGASTLYGPDSALFLREQFGCLAARLEHKPEADHCHVGQPDVDTLVPAPYKATLADVFPAVAGASAAPSNLAAVHSEISYDGERIYSVAFDGPKPDAVRAREDLAVSVKLGCSTVADGGGQMMHVVYDDQASERPWKVVWIAPLDPQASVCGKLLHFVVGTRRGSVSSQPFVADCSIPKASQVWP
jgi:neutral ceramidase